ncbi:MAG: DsbA family protein [Rhodobacteraceae bacterium]|nr:DsbA family protein [Paracoccaceae bacterium]
MQRQDGQIQTAAYIHCQRHAAARHERQNQAQGSAVTIIINPDITPDPVYPWCYTGKTRLDRAAEANPNHDLTVEWYPFRLNPDMSAMDMDRRTDPDLGFGDSDSALRVCGADCGAFNVAGKASCGHRGGSMPIS